MEDDNDSAVAETRPGPEQSEVGHLVDKDAHRRLNRELLGMAKGNAFGVFGIYPLGEDLRLQPLEDLTAHLDALDREPRKFLGLLRALVPIAGREDCRIDPAGLCGLAIGRHMPAKDGNPNAWEVSAIADGHSHTIWWHPDTQKCYPIIGWTEPNEHIACYAEAFDDIIDALPRDQIAPAADGGAAATGDA
ncbi:hypothetical protein GCM10029992_36620 [Glycomyces albus]